MKCRNCIKEVSGKNVFCGRSCAATYNNTMKPKRKKKEIRYCLNCSKQIEARKYNIYCDNKCCSDFIFTRKTSSTILEGKCSTSTTLKKYLKITLGEKCSQCELGNSWNDKKLNLQLDHIDGNSDNNDLSNLRLLCPNCHSQTETYNRKNNVNAKRATYLRKYHEKLKKQVESIPLNVQL